eukprot:TRINITY_DN2930_c3_g2_i1.p1 TRINITY_DN2930_c3_g2~~TRINITY_DN2930_c3_g2_i1.p1  ORF type:complete len:250 (+),score=51.94 TRINITY_DN2930_c3_g2_i1:66-752(+)
MALYWTKSEVKTWLEEGGVGQDTVDMLFKRGVDGKEVLQMERQNLKTRYGVRNLTARKRMYKLLENLGQEGMGLTDSEQSSPRGVLVTPPRALVMATAPRPSTTPSHSKAGFDLLGCEDTTMESSDLQVGFSSPIPRAPKGHTIAAIKKELEEEIYLHRVKMLHYKQWLAQSPQQEVMSERQAIVDRIASLKEDAHHRTVQRQILEQRNLHALKRQAEANLKASQNCL